MMSHRGYWVCALYTVKNLDSIAGPIWCLREKGIAPTRFPSSTNNCAEEVISTNYMSSFCISTLSLDMSPYCSQLSRHGIDAAMSGENYDRSAFYSSSLSEVQ